MNEKRMKQILIAAVLVLIALSSILLVADKAGSFGTHARTIASIDAKVQSVLKLTATSTLASAGISAIPGDTATPIAEKLADFTEYFLLILCVLYAEKYLLTILGLATFKILIPAACALLIVGLFWKPHPLRGLAVRVAALGLALFVMIPVSVRVSDLIYATYQDSIEQTITAAEEFTDETDELAKAKEDQGLIDSILEKISETAASLSDKAAKTLNRFVESLAVMIVTACLIPLLVLFLFIRLIRLLFRKDLMLPILHRPIPTFAQVPAEHTHREE